MKINHFCARFAAAAAFVLFLAVSVQAEPAQPLDTTPRIAVMSAFPPEWTALLGKLKSRKDHNVHGITFATGTLEGKPVVLFLSGISMVNASMTTQMVLDRFSITRIVFSGIAGGADPALTIGDVAVPQDWTQYLEAVFAREVKPGSYELPSFADKSRKNFHMIFPQPVEVMNPDGTATPKTAFAVDPQLLALARTVAKSVTLKDCAGNNCLARKPKIVVGGHGVSGQAFVDNKEFREYAHATFGAGVIDMETAAVAQVAQVNQVPFIAFRSLSDLAGGGPGENEMGTFFQLAADNSAAVVEAFVKALP